MAIVKEIKVGNATIKFDDKYYRDKTPEENRKTREEAFKSISEIVADAIANGRTKFQQSEYYPDYQKYCEMCCPERLKEA